MAITRLGSATSSDSTGTHTHAVPAGSDRMLVVCTGREVSGDSSATAVDYGGQAMVQAVQENTGISGFTFGSSNWYLLETEIALASNTTITVTWSLAPADQQIHAAAYGGVDQTGGSTTNPSNNSASSTASTPNPLISDVTEVVDGLVIATRGSGNNATHTWASDMTEQTDQADVSSGSSMADRLSTVGGNVNVEGTSANQNRGSQVVSVFAGAAAGTTFEDNADFDFSLSQSNMGEVDFESAITAGLSLSETNSAFASIYEEIITLAFSLSEAHTVDGSIYEEAITLGLSLNKTNIGEVDFESLATFNLSFNQANLTEIIFESEIPFGISLFEINTGEVDFESGAILGLSLSKTNAGEVEFEPAIAIGFSLNEFHNVDGSIYEENITLGLLFDQINVGEVTKEAVVTFGLSISETNIGEVDFEPAITFGVQHNYFLIENLPSITLDFSFGITVLDEFAGVFEDSMTLGLSFNKTNIAQTDFEPVIIAGLSLSVAHSVSTSIYEENITLGIQFDYTALDELVAAPHEESITLGLSFDQALVVQIDFESGLTFGFQFNKIGEVGSSVYESSVVLGTSFNFNTSGDFSFQDSIILGISFEYSAFPTTGGKVGNLLPLTGSSDDLKIVIGGAELEPFSEGF